MTNETQDAKIVPDFGSYREASMASEIQKLKDRLYGTGGLQARNIGIFPGTNPHATPEDVAREINKALAQLEVGDYEIVPDSDH